MVTTVQGAMGPVILARLEPHGDLLESIFEVAREYEIKAGVILSITGALEHAVLQHFETGKDNTQVIGVEDYEGPMEVSGTGIIGTVFAPDRGDVPFGVGGYQHGEPYMHVHLTITTATETICGHVMPGCRVRSNHPISHFTVMIAPIEDTELRLTIDGTPEDGHRGVYHELYTAATS